MNPQRWLVVRAWITIKTTLATEGILICNRRFFTPVKREKSSPDCGPILDKRETNTLDKNIKILLFHSLSGWKQIMVADTSWATDRWPPSSNILCVFLHLFRWVFSLVSNSIISSSGRRELFLHFLVFTNAKITRLPRLYLKTRLLR